MKRLKLDLDRLEVESFQAAEPLAQRGTVAAHSDTGEYHCSGASYCCTHWEGCVSVVMECPQETRADICW